MSKRTRLLSKLKHVYSHNTKLVLDVSNDDIGLIIEALEKQIKSTPIKSEKYLRDLVVDVTFRCSVCGREVVNEQCYCECGQKQNWERWK